MLRLLLALAMGLQASGAGYIVTAESLKVRQGGGNLCIAVDTANAKGVWWWQPGPKGCGTRMTGPEVFHAIDALVAPSWRAGAFDVRFRLSLIARPPDPQFEDIALVLEAGSLRSIATGAKVSITHRNDLNVPAAYP